MDRIWLQSYPEGVPAEITPTHENLVDVIEQAMRRFAERPAFVNMGRSLTYADLDRLSASFASFLKNELGLESGARVALMMPNLLQYPVALFGVLRAGCVAVNVNPLYTPRELEHQLTDSGAEAIVVLENFARTLEKVGPLPELRHVVVTAAGDLLGGVRGPLVNFVLRFVQRKVPQWNLPGHVRFSRALSVGHQRSFVKPPLSGDDIAFLQYTGGTTGRAKGAILTHANLCANLAQARAWIGPKVREGEELIVTALPLYHVFSLMANCLMYSSLGATNLLITNPRDVSGFVKELGKHRFTAFTGVNTLFNALLNHPDFAKIDFSALKITLGGGMAVRRKVAERWREVTGNTLLEAYGLTETSPAVSINPLDLDHYNGSIGLPLPSTDVSIRDENNHELPPGEPGELCVRGPQVMRGYWNRPEADAEALLEDGFFRTGDIATIDPQGFLSIVDRKKDLIVVSGFKVVPNEVEDVLVAHPGISEAAVIGVPDERSGEAVKLFVVRGDPALTEEDVIAHCRQNLAAYKIPHQIEFRDELPKSNVGKILRRALRDGA
ncbi:MAG TPA: AMP-binding protein [Azoarcus sp.]|nr:AMP-binding protein [Azoarcus sp.]